MKRTPIHQPTACGAHHVDPVWWRPRLREARDSHSISLPSARLKVSLVTNGPTWRAATRSQSSGIVTQPGGLRLR
jgi:hypothetical protein